MNSTAGVRVKGDLKTQRRHGRRPHEHEGRRCSSAAQAKGLQALAATARSQMKQGRTLPQVLWREHGPADTLILNF